jgi:hypothetical protein
MSAANVAVLIILFLLLTGRAMWYWLTEYRAQIAIVQKYRIFAVRDQLVRLVATKKIDETDESFVFLYTWVNKILPVCKPLSLRQLIASFNDAKPTNIHWRNAVLRALQHPVPEVREAAIELLDSLIDIILLKSAWARIFFRLLWRIKHKSRDAGRHIRPPGQAFRFYEELQDLRRAA